VLLSFGYNDPERFGTRKRLMTKIKSAWTDNLKSVNIITKSNKLFTQIKEVAIYGDNYLKVLSYTQKRDLS
jgi:hypothetical protein